MLPSPARFEHHMLTCGSHLQARVSHASASIYPLCFLAIATTLWSFYCFHVVFSEFYLYFVGYCLLDLYWFEHLVETFVNDLELVHLSSTVSDSDSNSASIAYSITKKKKKRKKEKKNEIQSLIFVYSSWNIYRMYHVSTSLHQLLK